MRIAANQTIKELIPDGISRIAVISDSKVAPLHGQRIADEVRGNLYTFPAGEASKTRETKALLEDMLLEAGFGRDGAIIAVGGGVVTDLAGFIAATFCRGVPLILLPTSLLAMADAAIGGKTGVNTPAGKNLIGTTYRPLEVVIDPALLNTLPLDELRNGVVEMIKHGLIANKDHLQWLVENAQAILDRDMAVIIEGLTVSCGIKQQVVDVDELEGGMRRILNFGHTVGHAIEQVLDYRISHGRAVAVGMLVEGQLSMQLAGLNSLEPIERALAAFGIDTTLPEVISVERLWEAMCRDKKAAHAAPRMVLLESVGKVADFDGDYCTTITREQFERVWGGK